MSEFKPKTSGKPDGFDKSFFDSDAVQVAQKSHQIAGELGYWYVATPHLLCSLLDYNSATGSKMFSGWSLSIPIVREAMLLFAPPDEPAILFNRPTSVHLWDCYMHAIKNAKSESRLATPCDILGGLLKFREPVVDCILARFEIEISDNLKLRARKAHE